MEEEPIRLNLDGVERPFAVNFNRKGPRLFLASSHKEAAGRAIKAAFSKAKPEDSADIILSMLRAGQSRHKEYLKTVSSVAHSTDLIPDGDYLDGIELIDNEGWRASMPALVKWAGSADREIVGLFIDQVEHLLKQDPRPEIKADLAQIKDALAGRSDQAPERSALALAEEDRQRRIAARLAELEAEKLAKSLVRLLLSSGRDKKTRIERAISDICEKRLARAFDIHISDKGSPLSMAAEALMGDAVEAMIRAGAGKDRPDRLNMCMASAVFEAQNIDQVDHDDFVRPVIKALLRAGADLKRARETAGKNIGLKALINGIAAEIEAEKIGAALKGKKPQKSKPSAI